MADRGRWSMARSRTQKKTSAIDVQRFSGRILEDKAGEVCRDQTILGFGDMLMIFYFILKRAQAPEPFDF